MSDFTITTLMVGPLSTNCHLFINEKEKRAVIIDAGGDAEYIKSHLLSKDLKPQKLIATHGHFDHINASLDIKTAFEIDFIMSKNDEFLLQRARSSTKHFTGFTPDPPALPDKFIKEGDEFDMVGFVFTVLETPGHTPGSITLYSEELNVAFVGDLIFALGGVGRTDFEYSKHTDLVKSIKKIFNLPDSTEVYSGHGDSFTVALAKKYAGLI